MLVCSAREQGCFRHQRPRPSLQQPTKCPDESQQQTQGKETQHRCLFTSMGGNNICSRYHKPSPLSDSASVLLKQTTTNSVAENNTHLLSHSSVGRKSSKGLTVSDQGVAGPHSSWMPWGKTCFLARSSL